MSLLLLIVIFTAIGGVLSVLAASVFLILSETQRAHVLPHGISFAIGALLAVAFWGLIPHAFEEVPKDQIQGLSATILGGILGFFVLEKLLIWRHCHHSGYETHSDEHDHHHPQPAAILILLGDGIHNFVDGILIAAAFLTDVKLGIVTSLAVAAHEIPQEVGDFAILLKSGYSKRKALIYNMLSSLSTVVGGILAFFFLVDLHEALPFFLAMAASSFIYVAVADLIPSLHEETDTKTSLQQIVLISAGVLLICLLHDIAHSIEFPPGKQQGKTISSSG